MKANHQASSKPPQPPRFCFLLLWGKPVELMSCIKNTEFKIACSRSTLWFRRISASTCKLVHIVNFPLTLHHITPISGLTRHETLVFFFHSLDKLFMGKMRHGKYSMAFAIIKIVLICSDHFLVSTSLPSSVNRA